MKILNMHRGHDLFALYTNAKKFVAFSVEILFYFKQLTTIQTQN